MNRICKKCKKEFTLNRIQLKGRQHLNLCDECLTDTYKKSQELFADHEIKDDGTAYFEYALLSDGTWCSSQDLKDYHYEKELKFIEISENVLKEDVDEYLKDLIENVYREIFIDAFIDALHEILVKELKMSMSKEDFKEKMIHVLKLDKLKE